MHRILANSITDKLIILDSDKKSEDDNNSLNTRNALYTIDGRQSANDALTLGNLPTLSNRAAKKYNNSNNAINNNKPLYTVKCQSSALPCPTSISRLPYNKDKKGNNKNIY